MDELSMLAGVRPESLRRRIRRGHAPSAATGNEWRNDVVWTWLVKSGLRPLTAVPLLELKSVLAKLDLSAGFELTDVSIRREGIVLRYAHTIRDDVAFALMYPALDSVEISTQRLTSTTEDFVRGQRCMAVALVDSLHVSTDSEFHVFLIGLEGVSRGGVKAELGVVADLIGSPLPFWPRHLRHVLPEVSPKIPSLVGDPPVIAEAGSRQDIVNSRVLNSLADELDTSGVPDRAELAAAIRDSVRTSAVEVYRGHLREMALATPHVAEGGQLAEGRYLWPVVDAAKPGPPSAARHDFQLRALGWTVHVGTGANALTAAQLLRTNVNHDIAFRSFTVAEASAAQHNFLDRMVVVDRDKVTLAHLGHAQWSRHNETADNRDYLTDPLSGAVACREDGVVAYSVPSAFPDVEVAGFDFEAHDEPFAWTPHNCAIPFPAYCNSAFSVGYGGSGAGATTGAVQRFLRLDTDEFRVNDGAWPLYRRGYSRRYTADYLRDFFKKY